MGLFSSIGKIAGGMIGGSTGGMIGGLAGGFLDAKQGSDRAEGYGRSAANASKQAASQLALAAKRAGNDRYTAERQAGKNLYDAYTYAYPRIGAAHKWAGDQLAQGYREYGKHITTGAKNAEAVARNASNQIRRDYSPYQTAGKQALNGLSGLITDPNQQLNYVQNNPFFNAMADNAQSRLFNNQAARGKVGSGGTAEALQNSMLLLGEDLVNNNINQRMNLVDRGMRAEAATATAGQNAANNIGNYRMQGARGRAESALGVRDSLGMGRVRDVSSRMEGVLNRSQAMADAIRNSEFYQTEGQLRAAEALASGTIGASNNMLAGQMAGQQAWNSAMPGLTGGINTLLQGLGNGGGVTGLSNPSAPFNTSRMTIGNYSGPTINDHTKTLTNYTPSSFDSLNFNPTSNAFII